VTDTAAPTPAPAQRRSPAGAITDAVIGLEHALGLHARARANARRALDQDQDRARMHAAVALHAATVPQQRSRVHLPHRRDA
jgi:hypothetical protein